MKNNSQYSKKTFTIFISATELSADLYASLLLKQLKKKFNIDIIGIGSFHLKSISKNIKIDLSYISSIGFLESLKVSIKILFYLLPIVKIIYTKKIDLAIFVDSPIINKILAWLTKKRNITNVYYCPPSYFITKKKEVESICSQFNFIITHFYQDFIFYKKKAISNQIYYMKHPFLNLRSSSSILKTIKKKDPIKIIKILIFPGSRKQEIQNHMPILVDLIKKLKLDPIKINWTIVLANPNYKKHIFKYISKNDKNIAFLQSHQYSHFKKHNLAIVKSGSSTLEIGLLAIPFIIIYKIDTLSFLFLKYITLKNKKLPYIGLANIILNCYWVPEYIQNSFNTKNITSKIIEMIHHLSFFQKYYLKKSKLLAASLKKEKNKTHTLNFIFEKIFSL